MAKVYDLLEAHTGKKWVSELCGYDNRTCRLTCSDYPDVVITWNSWARLYIGGAKVWETRNFRGLLDVFDRKLEEYQQ